LLTFKAADVLNDFVMGSTWNNEKKYMCMYIYSFKNWIFRASFKIGQSANTVPLLLLHVALGYMNIRFRGSVQ
jgi:hypothetical protein